LEKKIVRKLQHFAETRAFPRTGRIRIGRDLDNSFVTFVREKVEALLVEADPYFLARREQIVALATRYSMPAIYAFREFAIIGGLMSYGTSLSNAYHQAAIYAAKILKGEKAADLPVIQATWPDSELPPTLAR
jgi:putative ABC transport system substrate-binding protein